MNKFSIFFFALFTLTVISCSNDDDSTTPPEDEANYFALTVGNTWKYNVYRFNGSDTEYKQLDLVITNTITGTEIIDGETYFVFETASTGDNECDVCLDDLGNKSVRDSLGYLVASDGAKLFTIQNEDRYLRIANDLGGVYGQYRPSITTAETPAGNFTDVDTNTYYFEFNDGSISESEDFNFYRDGEGLIVKTLSFVSSPTPTYVMTLLEANVQN